MTVAPAQIIATALHGGLGNQLFQYAVARSIAHRLNVPLYLDAGEYAEGSRRAYLLDHFQHTAHLLQDRSLIPRAVTPLRKLAGSMGLVSPYGQLKCIEGPLSHRWDRRLFEATSGTYLNGWWFSEKYFHSITGILQTELQFKNGPHGRNADWLRRIKEVQSISVHIRRGDFVTNPKVRQGIAKCGPDYYVRAASHIVAQSNDEPTFFVFSDDIAWCRDNVKLPGKAVFVDGNDELNCHEDLRLMSHCKHNIIANSTFSWWGAWLNPNPGKVVVAPKRWITSSSHFDTHICPRSFTVIEN